MRRRILAVATVLALAFTLVGLITPGAAARDRTELFLAKLQGFKEVPGPGDPNGSGKAYITLVNNRACWVLNWFGIGAPTAAHIHIGRPAQAGPVVQALFAGPQGVPAPIERAGGCVDLDPALAEAIVAHPRQYYVNVHTAAFPDGAIRGQLDGVDRLEIRPARHYQLIAGPLIGEKEIPPADLDGLGRALIGQRYTARICYKLTWSNIAPPIAAHIHQGSWNQNGPVVVPFFSAPQGLPPAINFVAGCVRNLTFRLTNAILEHPRRYYVNVHTAEFPDGAIRAQIRRDRGD
jgi:CHRD domain